jgi:hypothetical protein
MADGSGCGATVWGGYIADLREQRRRWALAKGRDPDAIRLRIRKIDREIVHAAIQLAMATPITPQDGNCKPRTCPICKKTYPQSVGHFGKRGTNTNCLDCSGKPAIKFRTCQECGTEYLGVQEHFRRGGKIHPNCNACAEAKVRAKIEARLAKRGRR